MPWRLVPRYLTRHWVRTALTVASLVVATFLLCVLHGLVHAITAGVELAVANRLIVQSAVSLFVDLPRAYQSKIDQVDNVELTCRMSWFGGYYQDRSNWFAQFGVEPQRLLDLYPELFIVEGSAEEFATQRNA